MSKHTVLVNVLDLHDEIKIPYKDGYVNFDNSNELYVRLTNGDVYRVYKVIERLFGVYLYGIRITITEATDKEVDYV